MAIDTGVLMGRDNPRLRETGIALVRIILGVVFFAHGYLKFFKMGMDGAVGFFTSLGIPFPALAAWGVTLLEMIGGIALILGIFTPVIAVLFAIDMAGAIFFAKRGQGFFAPKGYEFELTLLVASVALALTGPGAFSLKNVFRRRPQTRASNAIK
ncbi:MAG: DoxX family protein [Gemmatimonadota bacterium]|nr:DoxX family protein [Gemmatimonadota bacterium]